MRLLSWGGRPRTEMGVSRSDVAYALMASDVIDVIDVIVVIDEGGDRLGDDRNFSEWECSSGRLP